MKFNAENNKERSLSCRSAVSVVAQGSQPCLYQLHVLSAMLSWWSLALFSLWIVPFCPSPSLPFPPLQRGEVVTSRCHGSKIFGWSKRKRHLKSEFAQLQTSSIFIQFHLIWQMLAKFSRFESESTVSKFRRGKRQLLCCVHLLHKASMWNWEFSGRMGASTAKKCAK